MFGHEFWGSSEKCSDRDQPSRRAQNLFGRVPKISKNRPKLPRDAYSSVLAVMVAVGGYAKSQGAMEQIYRS